jgi:hypothetical protein
MSEYYRKRGEDAGGKNRGKIQDTGYKRKAVGLRP